MLRVHVAMYMVVCWVVAARAVGVVAVRQAGCLCAHASGGSRHEWLPLTACCVMILWLFCGCACVDQHTQGGHAELTACALDAAGTSAVVW